MAQTIRKKKEALNTFENVTKMIIADEITGNSKAKIESLQAAYEDAGSRLRYTETIVKEKKIFITDTYESYVGKEFLTAERLEELRRILESGEAGNISEAIEVYKNRICRESNMRGRISPAYFLHCLFIIELTNKTGGRL